MQWTRRRFEEVLVLWNRYERVLSGVALVVGFTFDLFLAKRPDSVLDNLLLISYLFIAGTIIVLLNLKEVRRNPEEPAVEPLLLLLILQFCFGGLSSNLLVLYGKSGTLGASALFIGLLLAMLVGNEFLKTRYQQLRFNIAVYYILLLTYLIISIPTFVLHSVGTFVFLVSGLASLVAIGIFLAIVYWAVLRGRNREKQLIEVSAVVLGILVFFNGLYFLNIIPPVPLSLKAIGVYHSITRDSAGDYAAAYEPAPWFVFWRDTSATYTYTTGQPAYCFSSVFAPDNLQAPIFHKWEKYNETTGKWDVLSRISFPISGGRAEGYRGFSLKSALTPGAWRCDVETQSGALIGRISFTVIQSTKTSQLSTTAL